ncbi:unnamed protein product [Mortierella alpina]
MAYRNPLTHRQNENPQSAMKALARLGLAVDCSHVSSTATYIVDNLLNHGLQNSSGHEPSSPCPFTLRWGEHDAQKIDIPRRSLLCLHHIAHTIPCSIFLFSSKSHPVACLPPKASRSIAILHLTSSFTGISEYLALKPARCQVASLPKAPTTQVTTPPPNILPAAQYREGQRKRKRQAERTLAIDAAREPSRNEFKRVCTTRIKDDLHQKLTKAAQKPKLEEGVTLRMHLESKHDAAKAKLLSAARAPAGTLSSAFESFKDGHHLEADYSMGMFVSDLGIKPLDVWRSTVESDFEAIWSTTLDTIAPLPLDNTAIDSPANVAPAKPTDSSPAEDQVELRTVTATLKQVLRPELLEHYDKIVDQIEVCQSAVMEVVVEVSVAVQKIVLILAQGLLYECAGLSTPASTAFDITQALPAGFEFHCTLDPIVSPPPSALPFALESGKSAQQRDLQNILSPDCLRHIHAAFLGPRGADHKSTSHPLWDLAIKMLKDTSVAPSLSTPVEGYSRTISEHLQQLSTAESNMWSGAIYPKSLDYLIRILLRLHLAPKREASYKERVARAAQRKKEKASNTKTMSRSLWGLKLRVLCDELAGYLASDNRNDIRIAAVLSQIEKHRLLKPVTHMQNLPPLQQQFEEIQAKKGPDAVAEEQPQEESGMDLGLSDDLVLAAEDIDDFYKEMDELDEQEPLEGDENSKHHSSAMLGVANDSVPTDREPTRKRLTALQSVMRMLLESPFIERPVNAYDVRQASFSEEDFTEHECEVVASLTNLLRPYTVKRKISPKGQGKTEPPMAHVALRVPLVMIANKILQVAGYPGFMRRIAPQIACGSLHGLHLGAAGFYEALGSSTGIFDIRGADGRVITNVSNTTTPPANKGAVVGSFLDIGTVETICKSHGLKFENRICYVDRFTVQVMGRVLKQDGDRQRHPVTSKYEKRRKDNKERATSWTDKFLASGYTKLEIADKAAVLGQQVKSLEARTKAQRRVVAKALQKHVEVSESFPPEAKEKLSADRDTLFPLEEELRRLRKDKYQADKLCVASKSTDGTEQTVSSTQQASPVRRDTIPTWELPAAEDKPTRIDLSSFIKNARGKKRLLAFAGTDYGLVTMSETVPLSLSQVQASFNRFELLRDDEAGTGTSTPLPNESLDDLRLPRSNRITAAQVNEVTRSHCITKRRARRLRTNLSAKAAMVRISKPECSLSLADTLAAVDHAHSERKAVAHVLRQFETSNSRQKDLHTVALRTKRAWQVLCAQERDSSRRMRKRRTVQPVIKDHALFGQDLASAQTVDEHDGWCRACRKHHIPKSITLKRFRHLSNCPRTEPQVMPILLIGDAGTCVGSRLRGHARRGGTKMRREHQKYTTVAVVDEYRSSKVCLYCRKLVSLARAKRIVNGAVKTVRIHGATECTNSKCTARRVHFTIRPRDAQAAAVIGLSGSACLFYDRTFPEFNRTSNPPKQRPHIYSNNARQSASWMTSSKAPNILLDAMRAPELGSGV